MSNIVSIAGDFKLALSKISEPFREFYEKTTHSSLRPTLTLHGGLSDQFDDDSLKLINLNLIEGELRGKINPPARSLKTNNIWYFNRFISITPLLDQTFPTDCELVTSHPGGGVEWFGILSQISGFDSTIRNNFFNDLPQNLIEPYYLKLLKENPDSVLPVEIKENIENKLFPFFEKFKAK